MSESFSVFDACISIFFDMGVRRRPYHRFCDCALHKLKRSSSLQSSSSSSSSSSSRNKDGSHDIGGAPPCLRRSVTFPGDKKTAAKMNHRGRLCLVHSVETKKCAAGDNNVQGSNFLIEDKN